MKHLHNRGKTNLSRQVFAEILKKYTFVSFFTQFLFDVLAD